MDYEIYKKVVNEQKSPTDPRSIMSRTTIILTEEKNRLIVWEQTEIMDGYEGEDSLIVIKHFALREKDAAIEFTVMCARQAIVDSIRLVAPNIPDTSGKVQP